MVKKPLFLLLFLGALATSPGQNNSIGILASKISTLVFCEEIIDVEIGSQEYHVKVKGRYLLLRAKHKRVQPTSLFVRYGKKKHYYVAEIFPDENAPLQYQLQAASSREEVEAAETAHPIFAADEQQEYCTIGVIKNGIQVILTNILHKQEATYLRCFIDNTSSIDLCFSHGRLNM